jgi:hypothetical protein
MTAHLAWTTTRRRLRVHNVEKILKAVVSRVEFVTFWPACMHVPPIISLPNAQRPAAKT